MSLKLPNSIASSQDLTALILEVREYTKWFSHTVVKMHVTGSQVPRPPEVSPAAREMIDSLQTSKTLNQQGLDDLITALEEHKANAPSITVTLAAPAPGDLKQTIVAWFRQHVSPQIMVTFKFNATLLGGMVVRYGSHVFDWSFKRQILAARQNFPEILRRV